VVRTCDAITINRRQRLRQNVINGVRRLDIRKCFCQCAQCHAIDLAVRQFALIPVPVKYYDARRFDASLNVPSRLLL